MNAIDKLIGYFSPEAAFRRVRYRQAMRFSYDGAKSGRTTDGWVAASGDANTEIGAALVSLRNRSRELVRNNPYASKAIEELVGNSVGTGIVPQAKTGSASLDKIIDAEWPFFAERCDPGGQLDFYGMQALNVRTTAESGDGIIRFRQRRQQDNFRVPLQLQILESDFLDHSRTLSTDTGYVIQGVEINLIGQRQNYWLFNYHPGGVYMLNPRGGILSQPVPASEVMHAYRVMRPGQIRGVPYLAPIMLGMRDLDDYRYAERMRKKTESCLAGIVTRPEGGPPMGAGIGTQTSDGSGNILERMYPGMIEYLKPGEGIEFNAPHAVGGYREYLMTELEGMAAGVCMPFELMTGNTSNVNFSSYRAGQLGYRNTIDAYRWLTLIPMFCQPTWRRFIDTLVLIGRIKEPNYGVQWTAPKFESVDPVKDAEATLRQIRMGTLTLVEAISQNGYDPERQLAEYKRINDLLDKMGIILDCDPRNMTLRGQEQAGGTGEAEPIPPPKPAKAAVKNSASKTVRHPAATSGTPAAVLDMQLEKDGSGAVQFSSVARWDSPTRVYRA
jgi:lambda family phage portal protein